MQCERCKECFASKRVFELHKVRCMVRICNHCQQLFDTFDLLIRHIRAAHEDKVISCDKCGLVFKSYEDRKRHMKYSERTDSVQFPFFCDLCACHPRYSHLRDLKSHQKNHDKITLVGKQITQGDLKMKSRRGQAAPDAPASDLVPPGDDKMPLEEEVVGDSIPAADDDDSMMQNSQCLEFEENCEMSQTDDVMDDTEFDLDKLGSSQASEELKKELRSRKRRPPTTSGRSYQNLSLLARKKRMGSSPRESNEMRTMRYANSLRKDLKSTKAELENLKKKMTSSQQVNQTYAVPATQEEVGKELSVTRTTIEFSQAPITDPQGSTISRETLMEYWLLKPSPIIENDELKPVFDFMHGKPTEMSNSDMLALLERNPDVHFGYFVTLMMLWEYSFEFQAPDPAQLYRLCQMTQIQEVYKEAIYLITVYKVQDMVNRFPREVDRLEGVPSTITKELIFGGVGNSKIEGIVNDFMMLVRHCIMSSSMNEGDGTMPASLKKAVLSDALSTYFMYASQDNYNRTAHVLFLTLHHHRLFTVEAFKVEDRGTQTQYRLHPFKLPPHNESVIIQATKADVQNLTVNLYLGDVPRNGMTIGLYKMLHHLFGKNFRVKVFKDATGQQLLDAAEQHPIYYHICLDMEMEDFVQSFVRNIGPILLLRGTKTVFGNLSAEKMVKIMSRNDLNLSPEILVYKVLKEWAETSSSGLPETRERLGKVSKAIRFGLMEPVHLRILYPDRLIPVDFLDRLSEWMRNGTTECSEFNSEQRVTG